MTEFASASILSLREKIGDLLGRRTKDRIQVSTLPDGIPKGTIVEVTGPARVEWVLHFLSENRDLGVAWVEEKFESLPTAFEQRGVNLEKLFFVEAGENTLRAVRTSLRGKAFPCIVAPNLFQKDEKKLKALRLLAEKANSVLILLSKKPHASWTIAFQLEALRREKDGSFRLRVLKDKGGAKCESPV